MQENTSEEEDVSMKKASHLQAKLSVKDKCIPKLARKKVRGSTVISAMSEKVMQARCRRTLN